MIVSELIKELEKLDPDAVVVIPNDDYIDSYREPSLHRTIFTEEVEPGTWMDLTDKERDRDQLGVVL